MSVGTRIREAREGKKLTQKELATMIGVTPSAVTNYEAGVSHPKEQVLFALFSALQVDANYLFQDEMRNQTCSFNVSFDERKHIEKYRLLDPHGKRMVDFTVNEETSRMEQEASEKRQKVIQLFADAHDSSDAEEEYDEMPIALSEAAGGIPRYIGEENFEMLRVPSCSIPYGATFGIRIKGDSMEPDIPDGCIVWVRPQDDLENGEVGIFIVEDFGEAEATCKEAVKDGMGRLVALNSINPSWEPLKGEMVRNARCIGKVVGTYCEE